MNRSTRDGPPPEVPEWAPRVTQREIRRLYETDAQGIYDEELIAEAGYGLLARCQSFIDAVEATRGRARCPRCSDVVAHQARKDEVLQCPCGWTVRWGAYFRSIQHKQLSGAEPVLEQFRAFVAAFPPARSPRERMLLIDRLIHGFHWYLQLGPTRPVAVNLIEGRLSEVVAFLEELTYGGASTPGTRQNRAQWDRNIDANRHWYASRRSADDRAEPEEGTTGHDTHGR